MKKRIVLGVVTAVGATLVMLPLLMAFEAQIINVTAQIENNFLLNPIPDIDFGTTFPQERLEQTFLVELSQSFIDDTNIDDLEYVLRQKPKCVDDLDPSEHPHVREDQDGNFFCPDGSTMMPLLCPYLSKSEISDDGEETDNDGPRIPPFHGLPGTWTLGTTLAYETNGRLIKSADDIFDEWLIDLKVPCFEGFCAQDWASFVSTESASSTINANDYDTDPSLEHNIFGCDLWIEVTATSSPPGCDEVLDLMLVLDRSGSIDSTELQDLKDAANSFITALAPSTDGVHTGQASFSTTGSLDLHLSEIEADAHTAINNLTAGGFTNLKEGIDLATAEMDDLHIPHERPLVKDVIVIITDGAPNRPLPSGTADDVAAASANAARAAGIEVFVVGVGVSASTETYLKTEIADSEAHYFTADDFADLENALIELAGCPEDN